MDLNPRKILKIYHIIANMCISFIANIKSINKYNLRNRFIAVLIILLDAILFFC